MAAAGTLHVPKYQQVYDALHGAIVSGRLKQGDRLPSEAVLGKQFGASRITITRALTDLQRAGFVERRAGSGTYVTRTRDAARATRTLTFGLLIPDLGETEIFEPICQGIAASAAGRPHALIWGAVDGSAAEKEAAAWALCRQYIEREVSGVFFAPLELTPTAADVNMRIVDAFAAAGISVVLLDRPAQAPGRAEAHDLVGIDNRDAGRRITEHLLTLGAVRPAFVALAHAAFTVDARFAGFRDALVASGRRAEPDLVVRLTGSDDRDRLASLMTHAPDAIVCANDHTAGLVMHQLIRSGCRIPHDVRLVGIDDVRYAALLPVPLTTLRQPCRDIGTAAMTAMLDRLDDPGRPPRDIYLHPTLIVRASCGARLHVGDAQGQG